MSDHAEEVLLQCARAGDRAAFDRLRSRLAERVLRFTKRLIGSGVGEEEIVHRALLALYLNLQRIETADKLRPFLFRVVRNLCYDELRRQGRFRAVSLTEYDDPDNLLSAVPDHRPPMEDVVQWSLLYAEVRRAMERLPELHRQTLILYAEEDLTYAQIAEAMATDISTVRARLHHARKGLLRRLRPDVREALCLREERRDAASRGQAPNPTDEKPYTIDQKETTDGTDK